VQQHEALEARSTKSAETQLRIAENSDSRLVLLNLAMNRNLEEQTITALFDREISYVSRRLKALGYKD
jgi:hypothetical protein